MKNLCWDSRLSYLVALQYEANQEETIRLEGMYYWVSDYVNRPGFEKLENTTFCKMDVFPSSSEGLLVQ
jgi:hypothetical protein